jgi:hypothetical protein
VISKLNGSIDIGFCLSLITSDVCTTPLETHGNYEPKELACIGQYLADQESDRVWIIGRGGVLSRERQTSYRYGK